MEIEFPRDTEFRNRMFVAEHFAHPAKMDAQLLIWIVERYSKVGETILDPMAGSGTTMLACQLGRNVVLVELEEKFCKMMQNNWAKVKQMPSLFYQMGSCQIIQGDARQLGGLYDKIITSPPYSDISMGGGLNTKPPRKGHNDQSGRNPDSPSQRGLVDKIVTSPPFGEAHNAKELGVGDSDRADLRDYSYLKSGTKGQIGDLPYGEIDKCIFSPPYEEAMGEKHHSPRADKLAKEKSNPTTYTGQIDKIVTSPPYEGMKQDDKRAIDPEQIDKRAREFEKTGGDFHTPGRLRTIARHYAGYAEGEGNIGNLKSQSYLEAMLQVYQQCYKVLKPKGLMILVTKNFIRNKQVVRLDEDTIELCEQAGFSFVERHERKLPSQSFWRVIYKQKYPDAPEIKHEDVLVFSKRE